MRDSAIRTYKMVGVMGMICLCLIQPSWSQTPELPAVKRLEASLVAPSSAWVFYGSSTTHTHGVAYSATSPPEIQEIARALGAGRRSDEEYIDAVHGYVRNNIEPDFRFGLSKGARGAIIDQSGTAFDQAELMRALLDEGGIAADLRIGTITLNAAQFIDWVGLSDASAACRYLANGGIPATIDGETDCGVLSGALSTVVMGHAWLHLDGQLYDPAYKPQIHKNGVDLAEAMGCGNESSPTCGATILSSVPSQQQLPGTTNVFYVQNANQGAIEAQLASYATNLQNEIQIENQGQNSNLQVADIAGGSEIDVGASFASGSALPYPAAAQYTVTRIPDQFRTTLRVQFDTIDVLLYIDESYGSRLRLWGGYAHADSLENSTETTIDRVMGLYLEWEPLAQSFNPVGPADTPLDLTINHPYSADGGAYGDDAYSLRTSLFVRECEAQGNCGPGGGDWRFSALTIVVGLGEAGESAATHFAALQQRDLLDIVPGNPSDPTHVWMIRVPIVGICQPAMRFGLSTPSLAVDNGCFGSQQGAQGAAWLAQTSRVRELIAPISNTRLQHHHSLGYALSGNSIAATNLNVETSVSITSRADASAEAQTAFHMVAAMLNRLEGGLFEQQNDIVEGGSGVSFLARSNANGRRLLEVTSANLSEALAELVNYDQDKEDRIVDYVNAGYTMHVPQDGHMGTVNNATYLFNGLSGHRSTNRLTYLVGSFLKGSAGQNPSDPAQVVLESTQLREDSIKDKKYFGVDLQSGNMKLTPPPDLVVGAGAFPYSLPFQRYYNSSKPVVDGFSPGFIRIPIAVNYERANPGGGWTHNFSIAATYGSDGLAGMGRNGAMDAAGLIAGLYTLRTIGVSSAGLRTNLAEILVANWAANTLAGNVVSLRRPPDQTVFVRLPDGGFNPPPGSGERLEQTGQRVAYNNNVWDYRSVNFALITEDGSILELDYNRDAQQVTLREREPTTWTFPHGVVLDFAYGTASDTYELTVSNNLDRTLYFETNTANFSQDEVDDQIFFKVSDNSGEADRVVKISADPRYGALCQAPLGCLPINYSVYALDGGITQYEYLLYPGTNGDPHFVRYRDSIKIGEWYAPTDHDAPFIVVDYDPLFRVATVTDNGTPQQQTEYFVSSLYGTERRKRGESLDALDALTSHLFSRHGELLQIADPLGRVTTNEYDLYRRLIKTIMPEGDSIEYTYDLRHNRLSTTQIAKLGSGLPDITATTSYVEGATLARCTNQKICNKPATETDSLGNITSYAWDGATGFLESVTRPAVAANGGTESPGTTYCYTAFGSPAFHLLTGRIDRVDDAETRVMRYAYDSGNHYVLANSTVDPASSLNESCTTIGKPGAFDLTTSFIFDPVGNVETIDGPRTDVNDTTAYAFDAMRRIKQVEGPPGTDINTIYDYDLDGLLRATRRQEMVGSTPVLRAETRDYYPNGLLASVADPDSKVTQYTYDAAGRLDTVSDPDGRETKTVYDLAGQVLCTWRGWQGSFPAPADPEEPCAWNPANYPSATGGALRYAAYSYTDNGRQASVTDGNNNATGYTFDGHDRPLRTTFPDGTWEEFRYTTGAQPTSSRCSASSQPCRKELRNTATIDYEYDALDRLLTKSPLNQGQVSYDYNLLNEPTAVRKAASGNDPAYNVTYGYDAVGRRSFENDNGRQVSYQYDQAGNRSRITWPDTYYVTYTYDAANRMIAAYENGVTELAAYEYDSLSRRSSLRLGGASENTVSYGYLPNDRLNQLQHAFDSTSLGFSYGYNDSGQVTSIQTTESFYLATPRSGQAYTANNLNQYSTVDTQSVSYTPKGNLSSWPAPGGQQTYEYDTESRLVSVQIAPAQSPTIFYEYDGLGRRVAKHVDNEATEYLLDGDEEIAEYDDSGTLLRRYIPGSVIDDRIAMVDVQGGNSKVYYRSNHQDSILATTDAAGIIQEQFAYDEYGNLTSEPPATSAGQPFRYTGRRYDEETGLYYYRARYYSPVLGRFLQLDPVEYGGDLNLYTYVGNDPLNATDPYGEFPLALPFIPPAIETIVVVGTAVSAGCAGDPTCTVLVGAAADSFLEGLARAPVTSAPLNLLGLGIGAQLARPMLSEAKGGNDGDVNADESSPPGHDAGVDVSAPGAKTPNRAIGQTVDDVRSSLSASGYTKRPSDDGKAEIWSKGGRTYVIRPSGSVGAKIDVYGDGKKTSLIPRNP